MRPPELAVVTGAASGIGLATAAALSGAGTGVIGVDLDERADELAPRDLGWVRGDVGAATTWDAVPAACAEIPGAPTPVACAGTARRRPVPRDVGRGLSRGCSQINVLGVVRGMQALVPAMIERGDGAVAVVCSVNSFVVEDELSAYSTSKAALLHATRSAAIEYARGGVRINAVCPGIIDTPLLRRHIETLEDPQPPVARPSGVHRSAGCCARRRWPRRSASWSTAPRPRSPAPRSPSTAG